MTAGLVEVIVRLVISSKTALTLEALDAQLWMGQVLSPFGYFRSTAPTRNLYTFLFSPLTSHMLMLDPYRMAPSF
jgi:hypothetical protein